VGGRWVGRRLGKEGGVIGRDYVRRDGKLVGEDRISRGNTHNTGTNPLTGNALRSKLRERVGKHLVEY
jgi:hypothetical protein